MIARLRQGLGGPGVRRLAQRSGWTISATAVATLSIFGETILLARHLGPEVYGVFLLVIAFPEAVLQVLDLRVKEAMNRYLGASFELDDRPRSVALLKLFWLLDVLVGVACLAIVVVAAGPMAKLITGDAGNGDLMILYSIGLLFGTLDSAAGTVLRLLDRFRLVFVAASLANVARLVLVALAVVLGGGIEAIVWARVAAEVLLTAVVGGASLVLLKRLLWAHRRAPMRAIADERRQILRFLASTNLTGTLKMASTKLDTILVGALATPAAVALYRFAVQFARAPLMLSDALYTAIFPTISRAAAAGRDQEIRSVTSTSTRILAATVLPGALVAALLGEQILGLAGGERYAEGGTVFAVVLLSVMPYALLFWLRPVILTAGHAGVLLRYQAIGTALQMIGIVLLVPWLGIEGAAIALSTTNVVIVAQQWLFVRRRGLVAARREPAGA